MPNQHTPTRLTDQTEETKTGNRTLWRTYIPRPQRLEALPITEENFEEIAALFDADIKEKAGSIFMTISLPVGDGTTIREHVGVGSVLIRHENGYHTVAYAAHFDSEYMLEDPADEVAPEHLGSNKPCDS